VSSLPTEPAAAGGEQLGATGLRWGIKSSFLDYLRNMPGSQSSVTGANFTSKKRFHFPLAESEYDPVSGQGTIKFSGDVRFAGHFGMLLVVFIEPWVTMTPSGGLLSFADPDYYPDSTRRLPMLDLTETEWVEGDGIRHWPSVAGALRPEALEFFNNVYPVGQPFDPLDIRIRV
jgi:hypothetical protein